MLLLFFKLCLKKFYISAARVTIALISCFRKVWFENPLKRAVVDYVNILEHSSASRCCGDYLKLNLENK